MRTIASTRSSSVESETASTPDRRKASLKVASRRVRGLSEAAPEALVVGVDVELLAGLGVLHDQRPTSGSSTSRRSNSRTARTSCRWVSRFSGRSQPGALMKSEITKTSERRLIVCWPASSSGAGW